MTAVSSGGGSSSSVPVTGRVISSLICSITLPVLAVCIGRRLEPVKSWRQVSFARLLLLLVYIDSFAFVFLTGFLERGFGVDRLLNICGGAQLLCLFSYVSSKLFLYLFLVEKAYIVRGKEKPRLKDKLYIINFFGMLIPYGTAFTLNTVFRFYYIAPDGLCYLGIKRLAQIPTITSEVIINVYLTALFILPIRKLYSYRSRNTINSPIRTAAVRTFIGSCVTLIASVMNLSVILILETEVGWMCLMLCTLDILFMVLVLHWVTAVDSGPPKLQSRFNPDNSRSVFHYRGNPVLNTTSNTVTYTNGYDNHNGILSVDDTVSRPSPMHCVNGLGNGNLPYINPSDRVSTSATGGDNEHQIVTATNINVRTMTHLGDCQNENDRCSCCGDGIEQHNQRADERIASMDEIV